MLKRLIVWVFFGHHIADLNRRLDELEERYLSVAADIYFRGRR